MADAVPIRKPSSIFDQMQDVHDRIVRVLLPLVVLGHGRLPFVAIGSCGAARLLPNWDGVGNERAPVPA